MFEYVVEGLLLFGVAIIGILGNVVAIAVFAGKYVEAIFYRFVNLFCCILYRLKIVGYF